MSRKLSTLSLLLGAALVILCAAFFGTGLFANETSVDWAAGKYTGSREEVLTLMKFYETLELTPDQEAVRLAALQPLPAACCNNFSAATCCCECNLSRSIWGLSKHLIVEHEADAEQVRTAVEAWIQVLKPDGYEGTT